MYFMLQGVAILLEQAFEAATRRKVGGSIGKAWTLASFALPGMFTISKAWSAAFRGT